MKPAHPYRLPKRNLRQICQQFRRDESGSGVVETVLVLPLLIFLILFIITFFLAFGAKTDANQANYTISDYLSRQTDEIDGTFVDGLADLYRFLNNDADIALRASAVQYVVEDDGTEYYQLVWSYGTGNYDALTDSDLDTVESVLPMMSDGEQVLVVETSRTWSPFFDVGLGDVDFTDVVTTKPRFSSQVAFDDGTVGSGSSYVHSDGTEDSSDGLLSSIVGSLTN
ncbi:TadE/TadG family type IV pilus assembly protein [Celeribacter halophilus]|uniref:TadE/TadG family type IV pilus assembly protein n=1 Tax=Celeribacter halophilus TaxID=576117 RepID=A0AAW7XQW0_9RHOB|nr:TadE/TadG family type IV pilus assembly protein [Celeribacter halophilus]MDO6456722.1 TadE/TadG family type IV pilus assembly protein [Celeribacter halophilus]MDO6723185.1 TadE/TadG family type IV pilus assembly protein [Celeribacter halophilus]